MGWNKEIIKIKKTLKDIGSDIEIEEFVKSEYIRPYIVDRSESNLINSFQEYIQDGMDWELYVKTVKDGY